MTPFSANESARISIITWVIILMQGIWSHFFWDVDEYTIKENKFFMFAKIIQWKLLSVKNKRPSKKSLKLNLFWNKNFSSVKIRASVILSKVYDYGNLNKVRRNVIPSTLRASKIIIALTRNNCCTNFNRRKFLFQKRLSLRGLFLFGLLLPSILWFLYFLSR